MKKKHLSEEILPWALTEVSVLRHLREGACTILTVKACYPVLTQDDHPSAESIMATAEAALRFNACYADAAEAFVRGGLSVAGPEVKALYDAVGAESRSLFLRWALSCRMIPRREREGELWVAVDRLYGTRRSRNTQPIDCVLHRWFFPRGVMAISREIQGQKLKKIHKSY